MGALFKKHWKRNKTKQKTDESASEWMPEISVEGYICLSREKPKEVWCGGGGSTLVIRSYDGEIYPHTTLCAAVKENNNKRLKTDENAGVFTGGRFDRKTLYSSTQLHLPIT